MARKITRRVWIYLLTMSATIFSVVTQSSVASVEFFASWLSSSGEGAPNGMRYAPAYLFLSCWISGAVAAKREVIDPWRGAKQRNNIAESVPPTKLIAPAEQIRNQCEAQATRGQNSYGSSRHLGAQQYIRHWLLLHRASFAALSRKGG